MEPTQNTNLTPSKIVALLLIFVTFITGLILFIFGITVQNIQEYLEGGRQTNVARDVITDKTPPSTEPILPQPNDRMLDNCVITGCGGEICASEEMASICIYKEEFACYANATCARNPQGECGWVMNEELTACLSSYSDKI